MVDSASYSVSRQQSAPSIHNVSKRKHGRALTGQIFAAVDWMARDKNGVTVGEWPSRDKSNDVENEWLCGSSYFSGVPKRLRTLWDAANLQGYEGSLIQERARQIRQRFANSSSPLCTSHTLGETPD
jgi:hypothetical protein